jgi:iron(III) transport system ATP-binding protein
MLKVHDLRLRYRTDEGEVEAVRGLSMNVEHGEFYTLLGPSGCGKTSTLRCIAGLETPTSGAIEIDKTVVYSSSSRTLVPPHRRNIGMVFQSYAIWPHMSVFDNVAFPLVHGVRKQPRRVVEDKVMHALSMVQLDGLATRPAPMLSGGQQQRVALARAIASEPAVLLLDEPLSNLDAKLREDMRHEIKTLVRRLETTTLYVTHDQLEALSMSDRVALVNNGQIVQEGAPRDVYLRPADAFAANFLGRTNLLEGVVSDVGADGEGRVETRHGTLVVVLPGTALRGSEVTVGFRPESVMLSPAVAGSNGSAKDEGLHGRIAATSFVGDSVEYQIELGSKLIRAKGQPFHVLEEGREVIVHVPPERCYVLDAPAAAPASV